MNGFFTSIDVYITYAIDIGLFTLTGIGALLFVMLIMIRCNPVKKLCLPFLDELERKFAKWTENQDKRDRGETIKEDDRISTGEGLLAVAGAVATGSVFIAVGIVLSKIILPMMGVGA